MICGENPTTGLVFNVLWNHPSLLAQAGVLDPILNIDTKFFIDPLLIPKSKHATFSRNAPAISCSSI